MMRNAVPTAYKLAADLVVLAHAAYVSFVLFGQLGILAGILCRWEWIRNRTFRWLHLAAISLVVLESLLGIVCPLTTLETWLRRQAGQTTYAGDFIGHWVHELLFYNAPAWVFTLIYATFGLTVLAAFFVAPPRPRRKSGNPIDS